MIRIAKALVLALAAAAPFCSSAADGLVCGGLVEERVFDVPDKAPIWFGGTSRSENVDAREYCIYADIFYTDGRVLWGQSADFRCGTHDWETVSVALFPKMPVAKIRLYAFVRDGSGHADFKDVFIKREAPPKGYVLSSRPLTNRPFAEGDVLCERVWDGFKSVQRERPAPGPATKIENPLAPDAVAVWTANSTRRVTPLTFPDVADSGRNASVSLEVARNERESFQIIVSTGDRASADVAALDFSPLADAAGRRLECDIKWERQAYLARRPPYRPHRFGAPWYERWLPDPLLPAAPFKAGPGGSQGTWITVFVPKDAAPGTYRGTATVRTASGGTLATVPLSVRVRNFTIPEKFGLRASFSYMDGFTKPLYPNDWNERRREAHDVFLDHRLLPDDITRTDLIRIEDVAHMKARGATAWNLIQFSPPPKNPRAKWLQCPESKEEAFSDAFYESFTNRLAPHVAALKAAGLFEGSYIYGFDEREKDWYLGIMSVYKKLKRDFPDIPVMTTARTFNEFSDGTIKPCEELMLADWFCGGMGKYSIEAADAVRSFGRESWWYTCLGPEYPKMNFANWEYPFIEGRLLLGCCTWLYRADGYLFWLANGWSEGPGAKLDESSGSQFFEAFDTFCSQGWGDGILLYPGKSHILPGIRLANLRDGEEDWEWIKAAEKVAGRETVEHIVRSAVQSKSEFSRSHDVLLSVRSRLADLIEKKFVTPELGMPDAWHSPTNRSFHCAPSITRAANGRLWATWFGAKLCNEEDDSYAILLTSTDDGATWKEVMWADPDGKGRWRTFDPNVWIDPDGNLQWFFALCSLTRYHDTCALGRRLFRCTVGPAGEEPSSIPAKIDDLCDGCMLGRPFESRSGEWIYPVADWFRGDNAPACYVSNDRGKTLVRRGNATVPGGEYGEHSIVELANGDWWMCARTKKNGLYEGISSDGGRTWRRFRENPLANINSRPYALRLKSGNVMLIKNGTLSESPSRHRLTAYVSRDGCKTWEGGFMFEGRCGQYPCADEGSDGLVRVIYDLHRYELGEICMAVFTEADALAGRDVSGKVRLKMRVSPVLSGGFSKSETDLWRSMPREEVRENNPNVSVVKMVNGTLKAVFSGEKNPAFPERKLEVLSFDGGAHWTYPKIHSSAK